MRPHKVVLVSGSDAIQVSMVTLMLHVQNFTSRSCDLDGIPAAVRERFFDGVVLLERAEESLEGIAAIIAEEKRIPVLRVQPSVSHTQLLENVLILTARKRGPIPAARMAVRVMSA